MSPKKVNARELSEDIRKGLQDSDLMKKYELTPSQLRDAYKKLLDAGLVSRKDVQGRANWGETPNEAVVNHPGRTEEPRGTTGYEHPLRCPQCGRSIEQDQQECPRCGIVLSKVQPVAPVQERSNDDLQPGTPQDRIAGYYYAEASEAREAARQKRLWIIGTAVTVVIVSLFFSLLGYGRQVMLFHALGVGLFLFAYYFVVLHHCFKQSTLWGIVALCFSPAAILFVIVHWNTIYEGKILPKLWLALFLPLTLLSLFIKSAG